MAISLERVVLVSIFVESVLYGLFLSLYAISTTILLKGRRKSARVNKPMLAVSFAMLVFATMHVGVDLQRVLNGFLNPSQPASVYLPAVNDTLYLVKTVAYVLQTAVGDGILLYRLYLVWGGNRLITFPVLICLLATLATGLGCTHAFSQVTPDTPVFIVDLKHWVITFFVLTLITNFSSTCLIAVRIWWVHRATREFTGRDDGPSLAAPMILVIESGAIYSLCLIILISLYASGSFAQYIALDGTIQVIGIVFSLIIVRIGLGLSLSGDTRAAPGTGINFAAPPLPYSEDFTSFATTTNPNTNSNSNPTQTQIQPSKHSRWRSNTAKREQNSLSEPSMADYGMQPQTIQLKASSSVGTSTRLGGSDGVTTQGGVESE